MAENEDALDDAATAQALSSAAALLRAAADDVEALARAGGTPLTKAGKLGAVLEALGDNLERCSDWLLG